ncbi:MarR family winged helix-turn-helix transcriptional regulator [Pseudonocardia spirodelae]|uniref:MarR family transcriptional regulator n=1 Tax=Pseudonocardia spirodelae TaxID=3133431 RepID=A0ABU8T061_9PSEU
MAETGIRDRHHPDAAVDAAGVDAGLALTRAFTGISVRAVSATGNTVTLPQLRVLALVGEAGHTNVAAVGRELDVHPSNATRVVERLGRAGLLARRPDPDDRRHLLIELTAAGRAVLAEIDGYRRSAVAALLARVDPGRRADAAALLAALADAADQDPPT